MKQLKLNHFNKKLVLLSLILSASVALMAFFVAEMGWLSVTLTMEMALTFIALVVSSACCAHLFYQHQKWFKKEAKLKMLLLGQLEQQSKRGLSRKLLKSYLESLLEKHSSIQSRLYHLQHYRESVEARNKLLLRFERQLASKAVLEELGLNWY